MIEEKDREFNDAGINREFKYEAFHKACAFFDTYFALYFWYKAPLEFREDLKSIWLNLGFTKERIIDDLSKGWPTAYTVPEKISNSYPYRFFGYQRQYLEYLSELAIRTLFNKDAYESIHNDFFQSITIPNYSDSGILIRPILSVLKENRTIKIELMDGCEEFLGIDNCSYIEYFDYLSMMHSFMNDSKKKSEEKLFYSYIDHVRTSVENKYKNQPNYRPMRAGLYLGISYFGSLLHEGPGPEICFNDDLKEVESHEDEAQCSRTVDFYATKVGFTTYVTRKATADVDSFFNIYFGGVLLPSESHVPENLRKVFEKGSLLGIQFGFYATKNLEFNAGLAELSSPQLNSPVTLITFDLSVSNYSEKLKNFFE